MIWTAERNARQGLLVARMYAASAAVPCERQAVMAARLPGADRRGAAAQSGADLSRYLPISVEAALDQMAARGFIPRVAGLSPMEAAPLAHAEARFLAKRVAMLALADGRNLLLETSTASPTSARSWTAALHAAGYTVDGILAEISTGESARRADAAHRRRQHDLRRGHGHGGQQIPAGAIRALAGTSTAASDTGLPGEPWYPGGGEAGGLLRDYHAGRLTLRELASAFRNRAWAAVPADWTAQPGPGRDAADDPEPVIAGTFDDIVHAYDRGLITSGDYAALADAACKASRHPASPKRSA
jgi:hypothetical protein